MNIHMNIQPGAQLDALTLVLPDKTHKRAWKTAVAEFKAARETLIPGALNYGRRRYGAYLKITESFAANINVPPRMVPATTYFLMSPSSPKILGAISVRHTLNDDLRRFGGHIGYGIVPSERGHGYAARMLMLALEKCRAMSLTRVMVACYKDNLASAKTIQRCGGTLDIEHLEDDGRVTQQYWIMI
jgi:predicted acetyltransferase